MAVALELFARLAEILNSHEAPVAAIDKLRETHVVEVADFVGLGDRAQDLGDFFHLSKLDGVSPEVALRTKMSVGDLE